MNKVVSPRQAALFLRDNDIIAINGSGSMCNPEMFYEILEERYAASGSPRNITLLTSNGLGGRNDYALASRLSADGLVSCLISGHWDSYRHFFKRIVDNQMQAYNIPQGIIAYNLHNAAAHRPGVLSKAGLRTFLDPRQQGCGLNACSTQKFVELMEVDGEEYLFYKAIRPNVAVIRGTTADPHGNITMEKEALLIDPLATAMAAKNNGGKVIVQVERLSANYANPAQVKIPGQLVDAIYLSPNQFQTGPEQYNALYAGEIKATHEALQEHAKKSIEYNLSGDIKRSLGDRIIARRAALELKSGEIINLGIGLPMLVGLEAAAMKKMDGIALTIETGSIGGIPVGDFAFGVTINADALYDQASQFEFYEGRGLDLTGIGALEIDRRGNVNVARVGDKIFGVGGFNFTTMSPRRIVVCAKFQASSSCQLEGGRLIYKNGAAARFVRDVEYICLNADIALESGQSVLYITERCVFRLTRDGLELVEIGRGVDLERHILSQLPFDVKVSGQLKEFDQVCYDL